MNRSLLLLAAVTLAGMGMLGSARADSCAQMVLDTQAAVDRVIADRAAGGPSAPESDQALRGDEPTPESMARVEAEIGDGRAPEDALAALARARAADAAGKNDACLKEVAAAKDAIGLE